MELPEYLEFMAGVMREAHKNNDRIEFVRLIDIAIGTLIETKENIVKEDIK